MNKKNKIFIIIFAVVVFLGIAGFCVNYWYHTRISPNTPQAKATDCPVNKPIKGNAQSGIYHLPTGQYYNQTRPERCFATESEAIDAGYRKSKK